MCEQISLLSFKGLVEPVKKVLSVQVYWPPTKNQWHHTNVLILRKNESVAVSYIAYLNISNTRSEKNSLLRIPKRLKIYKHYKLPSVTDYMIAYYGIYLLRRESYYVTLIFIVMKKNISTVLMLLHGLYPDHLHLHPKSQWLRLLTNLSKNDVSQTKDEKKKYSKQNWSSNTTESLGSFIDFHWTQTLLLMALHSVSKGPRNRHKGEDELRKDR